MLYEWKPGEREHNFGDHLAVLLGEIFADDVWQSIQTSKKQTYYLLGSVIDDWCIDEALKADTTPCFVGCGTRGEKISRLNARRSIFLGCRGLLSQKILRRAGQSVEVIGDPAIIVPLLVERTPKSGERIFIPHVLDPARNDFIASAVGCDEKVSAITRSHSDLMEIVQK